MQNIILIEVLLVLSALYIIRLERRLNKLEQKMYAKKWLPVSPEKAKK